MAETSTSAARRKWRIEFVPLLIVALIAGGAWAFIEIADEVAEGQMTALDERLLLALRTADDQRRPIGPTWVQEAARDVTALGSLTVLGLLTAGVVGFLVLQDKKSAALLVILAIGSGAGLGTALKHGFSRERPELVSHESQVYTSSFPSGHSMLSAVTYLTLGALLMRLYRSYHLKAYIIVLAILLTVLIGVSRVYLGVHWPTDVLGGWAAGATWAMLWWLLVWYLQRKGSVEREEGAQARD